MDVVSAPPHSGAGEAEGGGVGGGGDVFVELGGCGFSTHAFWCR